MVLAPCPPPQHKAVPGGAVPLAGEQEALADENFATGPFSTPQPLSHPPSVSPRGAGALLGGSPRPSGPGGAPGTPERAPGTPWRCRGRRGGSGRSQPARVRRSRPRPRSRPPPAAGGARRRPAPAGAAPLPPVRVGGPGGTGLGAPGTALGGAGE